MSAGQSHIASVVVARPAGEVFAFMADPGKLDRWSFGTRQTVISPDGTVVGTSLFDGAEAVVRIDADAARLAIDYHLGTGPAELAHRITARVVPGASLGLDAPASVLSLIAWRAQTMGDDRWRRLVASHELEVLLIKALLETGRA